MKKIISCLLFVFAVTAANAQETPLSRIDKKISSYGTFRAWVFLSTGGNDGFNLDGELIVRGYNYIMKFDDMEIRSNGREVWTYTPSRKEVVIEKAPDTAANLFAAPSNFLALSEKDFKVMAKGTTDIGGKSYETLTLVPTGAELKKNIRGAIVAYDTSYLPKEVTVTTTDGLIMSILIKDVREAVHISDSEFTFDTSKAAEVIDFR